MTLTHKARKINSSFASINNSFQSKICCSATAFFALLTYLVEYCEVFLARSENAYSTVTGFKKFLLRSIGLLWFSELFSFRSLSQDKCPSLIGGIIYPSALVSIWMASTGNWFGDNFYSLQIYCFANGLEEQVCLFEAVINTRNAASSFNNAVFLS